MKTSKIDMSDMGPRPKDPRDGGDPVVYKAWKRVYNKRYYTQNTEKIREKVRRYKKRNPEKRNPEKSREYSRRYRIRNPEKIREKRRKEKPIRRARKKKADIPLTAEERQQVDALYAQRDILTETTGIKHHVDHIVPLVKGGIHHPINLRVITRVENVSKKDKLTLDAMALIPLIEALRKERQDWINTNQHNLLDLFENKET